MRRQLQRADEDARIISCGRTRSSGEREIRNELIVLDAPEAVDGNATSRAPARTPTETQTPRLHAPAKCERGRITTIQLPSLRRDAGPHYQSPSPLEERDRVRGTRAVARNRPRSAAALMCAVAIRVVPSKDSSAPAGTNPHPVPLHRGRGNSVAMFAPPPRGHAPEAASAGAMVDVTPPCTA